MSVPADPTQLRDRLVAAPRLFVIWLDARDGSIATHDGAQWPDGTVTIHHRHFPDLTASYGSPEVAAKMAHGSLARIAWDDTPAERDRLAAEVRGLEETAAERQQNALHWQERAEAADVLLDQARDEIERLSTDLAGWELYNDGPPPRAIDSTPDISDYQESRS